MINLRYKVRIRVTVMWHKRDTLKSWIYLRFKVIDIVLFFAWLNDCFLRLVQVADALYEVFFSALAGYITHTLAFACVI